MVTLFEQAVARFPDRPLFGSKQPEGTWRWMSYAEFAKEVVAMRAALAKLGVARGDRIACISNNRYEWAAIAYATYSLGAVVVPMYEAQQSKDWQYILKDSGAKVLFVATEELYQKLRPFFIDLPTLEHMAVLDSSAKSDVLDYAKLCNEGTSRSTPADHPDPDALCTIIYTSGTTGHPKGVMLSHANLASNVCALMEVFPMSAEDRSLSFLSWAHIFGQTVELHCLMAQGASMGISESVETIMKNLTEVRPTLLFSVPRIFNRIYAGVHNKMETEGGLKNRLFDAAKKNAQARRALAARNRKALGVELKHKLFDALVFRKVRARFGGKLKYAFCGGAAIAQPVAEFIDDLGIMVYEGYGLTETSPVVTANRPGARKLGSVGQALPGVRIEIEKGEIPDSKDGEVIVYGPNVMLGYYKLPEEDAKAFTPDRGFRTGDLGHLDNEGYLYLTGRAKEHYKLENGKFVSPEPLEEQLKLSPFILNAMVYGINRPYNVALIVADMDALGRWATQHDLASHDPKALLSRDDVREVFRKEIAACLDKARSYEKVERFALVHEDFTTANGMLTPSLKLKRRVVLARFGDMLNVLYP
ncbi:MAG: long-chain fatty acid--CoA ligase [Myxococcales bacterium]|nr:long-chain fatty acid--CoA ligase [Myxococcales bacterium]